MCEAKKSPIVEKMGNGFQSGESRKQQGKKQRMISRAFSGNGNGKKEKGTPPGRN